MEFNFRGLKLNCYQADGEVWFFGNNVARILGYKQPDAAVRSHTFPSDRMSIPFMDTTFLSKEEAAALWQGNARKPKIFINESGLYGMIFGSKLPYAEDFKIWVTRDVLPNIRQHGGYILNEEYLGDTEKEELDKEIKKLSEKVNTLTQKNKRALKRWHAAVAKRDEYKTQAKKLKISYAKVCDEADQSLKLINKILEEQEEAEKKIRMALKDVSKPRAVLAQTYRVSVKAPETEKAYRVNKEGYILID